MNVVNLLHLLMKRGEICIVIGFIFLKIYTIKNSQISNLFFMLTKFNFVVLLNFELYVRACDFMCCWVEKRMFRLLVDAQVYII